MEGMSTTLYKGLKGYWKRRGYQRLTGVGRRRKTPVVELGAGADTNRKRRFWRVKITRKIKLRCFFVSPKRFFTAIRDAYVKMMLRIANSRAVGVSGYGGGFGGEACFVTRRLKEYDEKMIVELYKSILISQAQNQLVPRNVTRFEPECRLPTVTS